MVNLTLVVENPTHGLLLLKTGRKAWDMCLNYLKNLQYPCKKINHVWIEKKWSFKEKCHVLELYNLLAAGGEDAKRGQFPHMALLGYGENVDWLCGGTLISDSFVVTAGHCTSSQRVGEVKYVALGILKRTDPPSTWKKYMVKRIVRHPDYTPPHKYHDIALLETENKVNFDEVILPACLHLGDGDDGDVKYAKEAIATGWGALGNMGDLADNLQTVTLQEFTEERCRKTFPRNRNYKNGYNHSTQMCYGDHNAPKDTCEGDSGGPLQINYYKNISCIHTIIGVTSFGRACGVTGQPGVYTRVANYLPWIESVVWP